MLSLFLLACSQELSMTPSQGGCTDFSYENPTPPALSWVPYADGATVTRSNILLDQSGLTFSPEVSVDHGVLVLREWWTEPETDDQFCYTASVYVEDFTGQIELRWYVGDDELPFETLLIDE